MANSKENNHKIIADNRRARFDYSLLENFQSGLMLLGTEVKSLRKGKANISQSYIAVEDNEAFLINADIPIYTQGNRFNHEPRRKRKLLLKRREIDKLMTATTRKGQTIVPTKLYFDNKGFAKLNLSLAVGKKQADKREVQKERDWNKQKSRLLRERS